MSKCPRCGSKDYQVITGIIGLLYSCNKCRYPFKRPIEDNMIPMHGDLGVVLNEVP